MKREKKKPTDQIAAAPIGLLYYVGVWTDACMHTQGTLTKLALQWDLSCLSLEDYPGERPLFIKAFPLCTPMM